MQILYSPCTMCSTFDKMWCDLRKPITCCTEWNCKIKEINNIMLFFVFDNLWTSVTFDTSITEGPSKKFWKEYNSNVHMIPVTQIWYFAPCYRFLQITSQMTNNVLFFIFLIWTWLDHSVYQTCITLIGTSPTKWDAVIIEWAAVWKQIFGLDWELNWGPFAPGHRPYSPCATLLLTITLT